MLTSAARAGDIVAASRTSIPGYLALVRSLVFRHEARRALAWAITALAGLAAVLPLLGLVVGAHRSTALAVLGIAGLVAILVVFAAVLVGWVVPRKRFASDHELARWIGARHQPIASDLLSSVELANAPARKGRPSPVLVDALIDATAKKIESVDPQGLMPAHEVPPAGVHNVYLTLANTSRGAP